MFTSKHNDKVVLNWVTGINPLISIISTCNRNTMSLRGWHTRECQLVYVAALELYRSDHAFVPTRRAPRFSTQYPRDNFTALLKYYTQGIRFDSVPVILTKLQLYVSPQGLNKCRLHDCTGIMIFPLINFNSFGNCPLARKLHKQYRNLFGEPRTKCVCKKTIYWPKCLLK